MTPQVGSSAPTLRTNRILAFLLEASMRTSVLLEKLGYKIRAFLAAQNGNVAITFAIALVPMVAAVGAAVDYSRGNSIKSAMQAGLDATALMLAKGGGSD